jgi:hypothetical protein
LKKRLEKRLTLTWQFGHQQERDIKKPKGRDFSHQKKVMTSEGMDGMDGMAFCSSERKRHEQAIDVDVQLAR